MITLFLCLLASEWRPFRALKMRPVRQEAVHSLWSRLFCGPLKMRRVPEKAVFGTEYLFRTVEACFLHRMLPKMRRVPQEAFLSTARIFRTVKACFRYRMPTTQPPSHHSTPSSPVPNARHRGRLPPQRRRLPYLRRDNQVINLIEVRSFRGALFCEVAD